MITVSDLSNYITGVEEQKFNEGKQNRSSISEWAEQRGKRIRTRGIDKKDKDDLA